MVTPSFRLEPLGSQHNEPDHQAWMSSIEHIRSTPGMSDWSDWPTPMGLADNLRDLETHAEDFGARRGFTYSVLDGEEVIGCVYLYPSKHEGHDAEVHSWVRADRAALDVDLWEAVSAWLESRWPFTSPRYASRSKPGRAGSPT